MAAKKKAVIKRQVWNKGLEVGKRDGFTPAQVKRIRSLLADRGVSGLRDMALFSTAIDTMLHGYGLARLAPQTDKTCILPITIAEDPARSLTRYQTTVKRQLVLTSCF